MSSLLIRWLTLGPRFSVCSTVAISVKDAPVVARCYGSIGRLGEMFAEQEALVGGLLLRLLGIFHTPPEYDSISIKLHLLSKRLVSSLSIIQQLIFSTLQLGRIIALHVPVLM
jgi:hypothetical protein